MVQSQAPDARRWTEGRHMLRALDGPLTGAAGQLEILAAAAERAAHLAHQAVRRGAPERSLGAAIEGLARIWLDATAPEDGASPFSGLAPDARRWAEGRHMLRALDGPLARAAGQLEMLAAAAERAADLAHQAVRRGKPERSLGAAIEGLAWIWLDATQRRQSLGTRRSACDGLCASSGRARGPAIAPLWPEAGKVDGLIDDVCTEFRPKAQ
jgi:hypothetical protein